jgi:hypothetical protein
MSWQIALSVASTAMSASQSMSQAKNQQAMYRLQAMQTEAESARKALQYEQRANETLRKVTEANAANVSRRYAGGVLGLEGSAKLIEKERKIPKTNRRKRKITKSLKILVSYN